MPNHARPSPCGHSMAARKAARSMPTARVQAPDGSLNFAMLQGFSCAGPAWTRTKTGRNARPCALSTACGVAVHAHFHDAQAVTGSEQLVGTCGGQLGVSQLEASKTEIPADNSIRRGRKEVEPYAGPGPPKHWARRLRRPLIPQKGGMEQKGETNINSCCARAWLCAGVRNGPEFQPLRRGAMESSGHP